MLQFLLRFAESEAGLATMILAAVLNWVLVVAFVAFNATEWYRLRRERHNIRWDDWPAPAKARRSNASGRVSRR